MKRTVSILLLLLLSQQYSNGETIGAQCKDLGQYCTLHSDCCSNSCLSFSYKCVENHQQNDDGTEPTTVNNIEELVMRFGGNDAETTINTYQTEPNEMPSTSVPIQTTTNESSSQTTNEINKNDSNNCRVNGRLCLNSKQCCSNFCSKITNLCIVPTPESLSTEQMTFTKPSVLSKEPLCYDIGHKCYATTNIECCPPLRCHGYLHQCVT